jgi:hypothetical protein
LRFRTMHGAARASIGTGFALLGVAAVVAVSSAIGGYFADSLSQIALVGAGGGALIASGAVRLPRWARLRGRQMDALAAQIANPPPT